MSTNNSKPKKPVVVIREGPSDVGRTLFKLVPSIFGSLILHGILVGGLGAYLLITHFSQAQEDVTAPEKEVNNLKADEPEEQQKDRTFNVVDVDPAATEFDTEQQFMVD